MRPYDNEKERKTQDGTGQNQCNGSPTENSLGEAGRHSAGVQHDSDAILFKISGGRTKSLRQISLPDGSFGGVLRQLRRTQTSYLSYLQRHRERLDARIEDNELEQEALYEDMKRLESEVQAHLAIQDAEESATEDEDNHQLS